METQENKPVPEKDMWPLFIVLISAWSALIFGVYAWVLPRAPWIADYRFSMMAAYAGSLAFWFTWWALPRIPALFKSFFGPLFKKKEDKGTTIMYQWSDGSFRSDPEPRKQLPQGDPTDPEVIVTTAGPGGWKKGDHRP